MYGLKNRAVTRSRATVSTTGPLVSMTSTV